MESTFNFERSLRQAGKVTLGFLFIPLVAMLLQTGLQWSVFDFIVVGGLVFTAVMGYMLLRSWSNSPTHSLAAMLAVVTTFLVIWVNLAVGLIGAGPHWGNWIYAIIPFVIVGGVLVGGRNVRGMTISMYAAAISFLVIGLIALIAGLQHLPESSVREILGINGMFAVLYLVSALLFQFGDQKS